MVTIYNEERLNRLLNICLDGEQKLKIIFEHINNIDCNKCPAFYDINCPKNKLSKHGICINAITNYTKR